MKLPIDLNPVLKSTHILAHPLGIISANESRDVWFPWLCNKFINCYFSESRDLMFDVYEYDKLFRDINLLKCQEFVINTDVWPKILNISEEYFVQEIKKYISRGVYIWGTFNEKYISAKSNGSQMDKLGDYLLYGFDDNEKGFYSAANLPNGEYQEYLIPYQEYYRSVFQPEYNRIYLRFLKYNNEFEYKLDIKYIVDELKNYINSTSNRAIFSEPAIYGLEAVAAVLSALFEMDEPDVQLIALFCEYRLLMILRLEYLHKLGYFDKQLYSIYKLINDDSLELCNLLRLPKAERNKNNNRIDIIIKNILEGDKTILPVIVSKIMKNCE